MAQTTATRNKLGELLNEALNLVLCRQLGQDAIGTAAAVGGLYLPPIRRVNNVDHPEEAETVGELHEWATGGIAACDQWDIDHPEM